MKVVSILMSFFHKWAFFLGRPIVSIFLGIVSIILLYMSQHVSGINLLEYYPHILVQLRHSQMFCDTGKKMRKLTHWRIKENIEKQSWIHDISVQDGKMALACRQEGVMLFNIT